MNSFWNTETTGQVASAGGGTGLTTAQMQNLSTFAGWDIDDVGGTGKVWRIYEGQTAPLLRSFLTTLDLNTINKTTTYNGKNQTLATVNGLNNNLLVSSGNAGGRNAGDYSANYYSNQQGYDLIGNTATLTINKAVINAIAGITANNKTYDGQTNASLNIGNASFAGMVAGDELLVGTASGQFSDKNAGTNKTVNITGLSLSGVDAGNYTLTSAASTTTADISKAQISQVSGITANNKIYDGQTNASLNIGNASFAGMVAGDQLNVATGLGQFSDKSAGTHKTVNITGLSLGGTDAGNYTLTSTASTTTADISKAQISQVSGITANNKVYDGQTNASLNISNASFTGMVAGDQLNVATGLGQFSDKSAGTNKTVNITGLSLSGVDAGNYTLTSTASTTTADISKAQISQVSGITANNKIYDGQTNASRILAMLALQAWLWETNCLLGLPQDNSVIKMQVHIKL